MNILIADDNPVDRAFLKGLLTREGHEVTVAVNGGECWAILQGENTPKLAFLDWHMPGIDGLEVCRRLRELPNKPYVFVILVTSNDQRKHLLEGLRAGADDYLTKPLDADLLRARLVVGERILGLQANLMAVQEQLSFQADHDSLTGLHSRAAILRQLEREMSRAKRNSTSLGVVMADIDFFKKINDTYGHAGGDKVLCEVARRLTHSVRPYDTVGRLGGEEFLIVLPNCDASNTFAQAQRLRECISTPPFDLEDIQLSMTISLGGASLDSSSSEDVAGLIARADAALYQAKHLGRNRVELSA